MEQITDRINEGLAALGLSQPAANELDQIVAFVLIIGVAFLGDVICRHVVLKLISKLVKRTKATWDDVVFDRKVMIYLSHLVPPILIYVFIPMAIADGETLAFVQRMCLIYIIAIFLRFVSVFMAAIYAVYSERDQFRLRVVIKVLTSVNLFIVRHSK